MYSIVTFDRWWHIYHLPLIKRGGEQQQGPYKVRSQHTMTSAPWCRQHDIGTMISAHHDIGTKTISLCSSTRSSLRKVYVSVTHMYFLKGVVVMLSHMLWTWIAQMVTHQSRRLHSSPSISLMCNCRPLKVSDNKQLLPIPDICHFFYTGRIFLMRLHL